MASEEQKDSGPAHHFARILAGATIDAGVSLGLIAGSFAGVETPMGSTPMMPPAGPQPVMVLNANGQLMPPSTGYTGVLSVGFRANPGSESEVAGAGQQEASQTVINLVSQGHQENQTFSKLASIIQGAFGAQNISIDACGVILGRLIGKYAQKVLENLVDDAIDYAADKSSEAIEHGAQKVFDEFAKVLSNWRTTDPIPPIHPLNTNFDGVLPPEAEKAVSDLRNELKKRSESDPQVPLDARTLSAFQSPVPSVVRAMSAYDPVNAEDAASYLRYRVAAASLNAFTPKIQVHALVRIVDAPVRPSTDEPVTDAVNASMPDQRLALDLRLAQDLGMSIGYQALGINSALVSKENVLDVVQLQNIGYQGAEQGLSDAVRRAQQLGCTWEQIGLLLGLTPQGAQQRFGPQTGDNPGSADQQPTQ